MFSAVDPIPMVQLINLLGNEYIVWDKSAEIFFKRPAKENLYAEFIFTIQELEQIRKDVEQKMETEIVKTTLLTNYDQSKVFCEIRKKIYVADKVFYRDNKKRK